MWKSINYRLFLGAMIVLSVGCSQAGIPSKTDAQKPTASALSREVQFTTTTIPSLTPTRTLTPTPTIPTTPTHIPITPVQAGTQVPESGSTISTDNTQRLTLLARWGNGNVGQMTYTPDGKYLVAGHSTGIYFYDATDFSVVKIINTNAAIFGIAITSDGQKIAASTFDRVLIFRVSDGALDLSIEVKARCIAFSPDGHTLATGGNNLQLWNPLTGELVREFELDDDFINKIVFAPDGNLLVTAGYATKTWRLDGTQIDSHGNYVSGGWTFSLSFSPDGLLLAEGAETRKVLHIYRVLDNGKLMTAKQIALEEYPISGRLAISPDGNFLAAAYNFGFYLWRMDTWKLVHTFDTSYTYYNDIVWSPDSKTVITTSGERGTEIWNVDTGELLLNPNQLAGNISAMTWSPTGDLFAIGTDEGSVNVLQTKNGSMTNMLGEGYYVNSLSFAPDGQKLAVGFKDATVQILGMDGTLLHTINGRGYGSTSVTFTRDSDLLAANVSEEDFDEHVQFWNTDDWKLYKKIDVGKMEEVRITNFTIAPGENQIAISLVNMTGFYDEDFVRIIKMADGSLVTTLSFKEANSRVLIKAIAYSPDGKTFVALTDEGTYSASGERREDIHIRLWQVKDWRLIYNLNIVSNELDKGFAFDLYKAIAWSPDGTLLAIGIPDGTVQVRRADNGELLQTLTGHTMRVTCVGFSPDGRKLASASIDGTVRLWGVK